MYCFTVSREFKAQWRSWWKEIMSACDPVVTSMCAWVHPHILSYHPSSAVCTLARYFQYPPPVSLFIGPSFIHKREKAPAEVRRRHQLPCRYHLAHHKYFSRPSFTQGSVVPAFLFRKLIKNHCCWQWQISISKIIVRRKFFVAALHSTEYNIACNHLSRIFCLVLICATSETPSPTSEYYKSTCF